MRSIKRQTTDNLNIDWHAFYRNVFALIIPMALQNLINVGVTAVDVMMLGRVGEKVLSGSSLAGQIQFIMMLIFFGITSGATVLTAQYWGKKDIRTIEKILGMGLTISLAIAVIFMTLALTIPGPLMRIFTSDPEVIAEGVKYLRIVGISYLFIAVTQVYLNIMRSIERVMIATFVYFMSLVVNAIMNAILIFGLLGFPALGIQGAAIGTLCARMTETLIVLIYAHFMNQDVKIRPRFMIQIDRVLAKDYLIYAIGHLGSAAVASNSVAQVARQLAQVVVFGIANATAVYLGKTIGERKFDYAKAYAKRFIRLALIMGCCGACVILICAPIANTFLVLSPEAKEYLYMMFGVMSYFVIAQAVNTTLVVGVFRSGGDTRFGLILDVSTMWGFSILLGAVAAFFLHASVPVVYILLMSDELVKLPLTLKRYRSYKWLKDVTRNNLEI